MEFYEIIAPISKRLHAWLDDIGVVECGSICEAAEDDRGHSQP